jgi:ATP-dependent Clp protease ATP-binding subunit ClpC
VILVGEAGVGKSCLVKGLVKGIIDKTAPDLFLDKKIYSLNTSSIVAGSIYRGQMEEKLEKIIKFFANNPNCILFIDEIHTIIGAGNPEGGLDFANILKPALAEDKISCIGATTKEEHDRFFKKESALNRRFEKVDIVEPTKEETFDLLKHTKSFYEEFHLVEYSDECLHLIVDLCDYYMTNRRFPDKAFDILDESGSRTKIKNIVRPDEAKEMEKKIENFKDDESKEFNEILEKYKKTLEDWGNSVKNSKFSVDKSVIYDIFAENLETSRENIEKKSNIVIPGKIGF